MRFARLLLVAAVVACIIAGAVTLVIRRKLPFAREAMIRRVESLTDGHVEVGAYRETWFPPGFMAGHIRWTGRDGRTATLEAVTLQASYAGLLKRAKGLSRIDARGLRITIPLAQRRLPSFHGDGEEVEVGQIRLEDAVLRFESSAPGHPPLDFVIHALNLERVGRNVPIAYQIALRNPAPQGEIRAHGDIGPVSGHELADIPASGAFSFEHADIGIQNAIKGILDATGRFRGPLHALVCSGHAVVPRFQVVMSTHAVDLAADFNAVVDARNGDTRLTPVTVRFNRTTVVSNGTVVGKPEGHGKWITLDVGVQQGRAEDVLILFSRAPHASFEGPLTLRGRFVIPPGPPAFLTRLRFDGQFTVSHGLFTNPNVQTPVDRLSASAEGKSKHDERRDRSTATAELSTRILDRDGIAKLQDARFHVPGVDAHGSGTFRLQDAGLDLTGAFETAGKLADTTGGFKSLFLKAAGPIWGHRDRIKTIPFRITGSARNPQFKLEFHRAASHAD